MEGVSRAGRGRKAKGFAIATLLAVLAIAPAAEAKGTAFFVGATNLVASQSIGPTGSLTPIGTTATGNTPRSAAVTPDAKHLYVSNFGGASVSAYDIGAGGGLTPISGSPFTVGTNPEGLAITPNGQFLYVPNQGGNSISGFSIDPATGGLTPITGSPFAVTNPNELAVTADGLHLYATVDTGVQAFDISATGGLSPVGAVVAAGTGPKGIATTPDSRFAYVGNTGSANLTVFSIGASGALTSLGDIATGNVPQSVAVSPDQRFVFVANSGSNSVSGFSINPDGTLTALGPTTVGTEPYGVDVAPAGLHLYVSNRVTNNISAFDIGSAGALTPISGSPFPANVNNLEFQSIAITPNQGPAAHFTAMPANAGQAVPFDATGSVDPDGGTVARFDWDFGDGQTLANGGPTPTHTYAEPGTYTVTLTVTDDEGCSNIVIFTGQTADCNGSGAARSQQTIQVNPGDPDLELSGKRKQELRRTVVVKALTLVDTAAVAKGRLAIDPGRQGRRALVGFRLKKDPEDLEAGRKTKLKPKLSKLAFEVARDALREGGKVTAKVTVKATSAGGETDKAKRKVKLTR